MKSILAYCLSDAFVVADVVFSARGGYFPWQLRLAISVTTGKIQAMVVSTHLSRAPALQSLGPIWRTAQCVLSMCLARVQLYTALPQQTEAAPASAFFRRRSPPTAFDNPHTEDDLKELQACWRNSKACSRLFTDRQTLAAMHNITGAGLDCMLAMEPAIASLIVSPDEAL